MSRLSEHGDTRPVRMPSPSISYLRPTRPAGWRARFRFALRTVAA